ncbi:MAG: hypothetical protein AB8F94_09485 [Saprospiraceae bacterium]
MGWDTTRIIRLFPKSKLSHFDIVRFCKHIVNTSRGLTHILWSKNEIENCFDIKFESSKSSGELDFDHKKVDVWELISHENGGTGIGFYGQDNSYQNRPLYSTADFFFDKLQVSGKKEGVNTFYEIIGFQNKLNQDFILIDGKYKGGSQYPTNPLGNSKEGKVSEVEINELLELRGMTCWIDSFDKQNNLELDLNGFLEFVNGDVFENYFSGLDQIEFYYKNRCVKQIKWMSRKNDEHGMWNHSSSDWWDNCANPNWIEYRKSNLKSNENFDHF